jgi:hypothetical protein
MFLEPIVPWATEINYPGSPASAWAGTPLSVVPVLDYFTPNTKPPAQFFNYLFSQNATAMALLQSYALSTTLINWGFEFDLDASDVQIAIAWDPVNRFWMLMGNNNDVITVSLSYGLDGPTSGTWINLASLSATNPPVYGSCCVDPATGGQWYLAYTDDDTPNNELAVFQYQTGSSTFVGQWGPLAGGGQFYGIELCTLGFGAGAYTLVAWASTDAQSGIVYSHSNAWPSSSTWPPTANFQNFGIAAMNSGDTVYMKSNGVQVICIPSSLATGGLTVWRTTTGNSWASSSSLASVAPSGAKVVGLCWTQDPVGPCWLACVTRTPSFNNASFFRSSDGVTWTAQSGGMTAGAHVSDMEAVGSHVKCTIRETLSAGASRTVFSVDGGITWYQEQAVLTTNYSILGQTRPRLASSSIGFMNANGIWSRFSGLAGLPGLPL